MKVLVTGHQGKIGTHLVPALVASGHEVRGFDIQSGGNLQVPGSAHAAIKSFLPDVIIHLAGTEDALVAGLALEYGASVVVASVAGGADESLRGNVVWLGLATVYGPGMGGVIGQMIDQEAQSRPGNQHPRGVDIVNGGTTKLDFIHISDVVLAFEEALSWKPGYYEVATGTEHSVWDAFRLLTFEWQYTPKKNQVHAAVQDPVRYAYTTRCDLPWATLSLEEGLKRTVTA